MSYEYYIQGIPFSDVGYGAVIDLQKRRGDKTPEATLIRAHKFLKGINAKLKRGLRVVIGEGESEDLVKILRDVTEGTRVAYLRFFGKNKEDDYRYGLALMNWFLREEERGRQVYFGRRKSPDEYQLTERLSLN